MTTSDTDPRPARDGETLPDDEYPQITDAECAAFERHAGEGALIDVAGEGVGYTPIQPYDLVRFCRTVRALRAKLAEARAERDAWEDLAEHEVWCRCCAEGGTENCDDGGPLIRKARELRAARAASGEDASNQQAGRARSEESDNG